MNRPPSAVAAGRAPPPLAVAAALALGAAISLGLARFSYALLLPPMREDLGWSYLIAGAMNTVNAAGYLLGALLLPRVLARFDARDVLLAGSGGAALLLAAHGAVSGDAALFALRLASGMASAAAFVAGGLLAARLAATSAAPASARAGRDRSGLVIGVYYGGTGLGIIASVLLVPPLAMRPVAQAWQGAWWALAAAAAVATVVIALGTRHLAAARPAAVPHERFDPRSFRHGLIGYFLFGLGYIGYMTFVITLLREQRMGEIEIALFYAVLGAAVVASSWLWAGLLQRHRSGRPLSLLNALLALATALPALSSHPVAVFASGLLFGSVFLSVVASTTALVRHNLPPPAWPAGIAAFTMVFAAGQIVGPSLVGWVADGDAGLVGGFMVSAGVLALGAVAAARQQALPPASSAAAVPDSPTA